MAAKVDPLLKPPAPPAALHPIRWPGSDRMSGARFTVAPEVCDRVPGLVVVVAWATGVDGNVAWVV